MTMHLRPRLICCFVMVLLMVLVSRCEDTVDEGEGGRRLAQTYCGNCHLLPEPGKLSKRVWREEVLPLMGSFLGVPGSRTVGEAGSKVFPNQPVLTAEEWKKIQRWYVEQAPDSLESAAGGRTEITVGLSHFRTRMIAGLQNEPPMTTAVRLDTVGHKLWWASQAETGVMLNTLNVWTGDSERRKTGRTVSQIAIDGDTTYLTALGDIRATEQAWGGIEAVGDFGVEPLINNLQRPVQSLRMDVDGNGSLDWVVAEFGKYTGGISWFDNGGRHPILEVPGAVRMQATDHDGDGREEIMVAFGQGNERVSLLERDAAGSFSERVLLRFPATNGTVDFRLADFNGDGKKDILYVNGDNADYERPDLKPYHGYTIYLRGEGYAYEMGYHFPVNGAYGARVADFDLDGDLDFATVAFFPDLGRAPRESFVYFENTSDGEGRLTFEPSTLAEFRAGRFMVIDAGDVDGDGDTDLAIGSYTGFAAYRDRTGLQAGWEGGGPAVILLENTTREGGGMATSR